MTDTTLLLDKREVASRLNVSPRMVDQLIFSGALPSCAIGRRRLVAVVDLELYVNELRQASGNPRLTVVSPGRSRTG